MADEKSDDPKINQNAPTRVEQEAVSGETPTRVLRDDEQKATRAATPVPLSVEIEDLSSDRLLQGVTRGEFNGRTVPFLGGIPLVAKLGQGGMGAVYLGVRVMLRQEVAVKVLPLHLAALQPQLIDRFLREAQVASRVESAHLVRVTDVNEADGLFYLVMEYVRGRSAGALLKAHVAEHRRGLGEAEALDLCIAATQGLADAHAQGIIHRDLKPDNILIPLERDGSRVLLSRAKVADLGLARSDELGQSLTAGQMGMGTPGFMAPEQAMSAKTAGKPSDVFGMAATLYSLLAGRPPFTGDSAAAVMMATLQQPHPPIRELRPDVSEATALLLDRCLSKKPEDRFVDGAALLEALKVCRAALSGGTAGAGYAEHLSAIGQRPEVGQRFASSPPPLESGFAAVAAKAAAEAAPPRRRVSPALAAIIAVLVLAAAAATFYARSRIAGADYESEMTVAAAAMTAGKLDDAVAAYERALDTRPDDRAARDGLELAIARGGRSASAAGAVTLTIVHSGDKTEWLKWAAGEYAKTTAGRAVEIKLITSGADESRRWVVEGTNSPNVWAPASKVYHDIFVEEWTAKHRKPPIARQETLTLTPHVFLIFEDRYRALADKYGELSFDTIRKALQEKGGWAAIAGRPEWGRFSFAFSRPQEYTNGLANLLLVAANANADDDQLSAQDVTSARFQEWAKGFEPAFQPPGAPEAAIHEMILKGPSAWDGLSVYESTAIRSIEKLRGRWGAVRVVYPKVNLWNESTYYVLDAPWSSAAQKEAAGAFLDFLLSEQVQKALPRFGFRPADDEVPILYGGSPFETLASSGIRTEVPITVQLPERAVVRALIEEARSWQNEAVAAR